MFYSADEDKRKSREIKIRRSSVSGNTELDNIIMEIESKENEIIDSSGHGLDKMPSVKSIGTDRCGNRRRSSGETMGSLVNIEVNDSDRDLPSRSLSFDKKRAMMMSKRASVSSKYLNAFGLGSFSDEDDESLDNTARRTMQDVEFRDGLKLHNSKAEKTKPTSKSDSSPPSTIIDQEPDKPHKKNCFHGIHDTETLLHAASGEEGETKVTSRKMERRFSLRSQRILKHVDYSIGNVNQNLGARKQQSGIRRIQLVTAILLFVGLSTFVTIFFGNRRVDSSKSDDKKETPNDSPMQQNHKINQDASPTAVTNAFDTAHQIVLTCIEKSQAATKTCGEMCASKRCCFDEFECSTIMTQRECSVYAGCLTWLREEHNRNEETQMKKAINELMNVKENHETNTKNVWTDSDGRDFSANLLLEACDDNNIKTPYGHDNCLSLCQQHDCCFVSSTIKSCSNEKNRCQIFSPCEKVLV